MGRAVRLTREWTAHATDGWSEPGHHGAVDAEAALERYLYG